MSADGPDGPDGPGDSGGSGGNGPGGGGEESDFDLEAFDAAFAAHFGATIEEPAVASAADGSERAESGDDDRAGDADQPGDADRTDGSADADQPAGADQHSDAAPDPDAPEAPAAGGEVTATVTAVVLTPLAHAPALAKLMGLAGMDWPVVATTTGAIAACALPVPADDVSALTGELPEEMANVAKALSHTSKYGVVLLSARMTRSPEEGPGGKVSAVRYVAGKLTETLAPGLVTTGADDVVEQLVLGQIAPAEVPGALDPASEAARGPQTPGASGNPTKRGPYRRRP